MAKLIIPESQLLDLSSAKANVEAEAQVRAGAGELGALQSKGAIRLGEGAAKIGKMQGASADVYAQSGNDMGNLIGKNAASAAASYARIGDTALQLGESVANQGSAMLQRAIEAMGSFANKSQGAVEDGKYNKVQREASEEFKQLNELGPDSTILGGSGEQTGVNSQYLSPDFKQTGVVNYHAKQLQSNPNYDLGYPRFEKLQQGVMYADEVENNANIVRSKYEEKLGKNPKSRARFAKEFGGTVQRAKRKASKEQRKDTIDFATTSLKDSLQSLANEAVLNKNLSELDSFYATSLDKIDHAYSSGYLSLSDANELKEASRRNIKFRSLETIAKIDPNRLYDILGMEGGPGVSNEDLGITQPERVSLIELVGKSIKSKTYNQSKTIEEARANLKYKYQENTSNLKDKIKSGDIDEINLQEEYNSGNISASGMFSLTRALQKKREEEKTELSQFNSMALDINNGDSISNRPQKILDKYFDNQVNLLGAEVLFDPRRPSDRARIIGKMNANVSSFKKEMNDIAVSGNLEKIIEASKAYEYLEQTANKSVSGLSQKTKSFYSIVSSLTKGGQDPEEAIRRARDAVYIDKDDVVLKTLLKDYSKKDSPFNPKSINSVIEEDFGDGGLLSSSQVTPYVTNTLNGIYKAAWISTNGDPEATRRLAISNAKEVFGTSALNSKGTIFKENKIMYAPPEKMYGPGTETNFSIEELKGSLNRDVSALLTKGASVDQSHITADKVEVISGPYTNGKPGEAAYGLVYTDDDGVQQPLRNPETGDLVFWKPDADGVFEDRVRAAKSQYEIALSKQRSSLLPENASEETKAAFNILGWVAGFPQKIGQYIYASVLSSDKTAKAAVDNSTPTKIPMKGDLAIVQENGVQKVGVYAGRDKETNGVKIYLKDKYVKDGPRLLDPVKVKSFAKMPKGKRLKELVSSGQLPLELGLFGTQKKEPAVLPNGTSSIVDKDIFGNIKSIRSDSRSFVEAALKNARGINIYEGTGAEVKDTSVTDSTKDTKKSVGVSETTTDSSYWWDSVMANLEKDGGVVGAKASLMANSQNNPLRILKTGEDNSLDLGNGAIKELPNNTTRWKEYASEADGIAAAAKKFILRPEAKTGSDIVRLIAAEQGKSEADVQKVFALLQKVGTIDYKKPMTDKELREATTPENRVTNINHTPDNLLDMGIDKSTMTKDRFVKMMSYILWAFGGGGDELPVAKQSIAEAWEKIRLDF